MVKNVVADSLLQFMVLPNIFICESGKTHRVYILIQLLQFFCKFRFIEREAFFASKR